MTIVKVNGAIIADNAQEIYDWVGIDAFSPKKMHEAIEKANGGTLEVHINSGGGNVFSGSEIYTAMRAYKGKIIVSINSIAASAASVIAMGGDRVLMSPTAQMMIHNVSVTSGGDYRIMDHTSSVLQNANKTIANAYVLKSGGQAEDFLRMMDDETWLTPQQALELKLIDGIQFSDEEMNKEMEAARTKMNLLKLKAK